MARKTELIQIRATPALRELLKEAGELLNPSDRANQTQVIETAVNTLHSALKAGVDLPWGKFKMGNSSWCHQYELNQALLRGTAKKQIGGE